MACSVLLSFECGLLKFFVFSIKQFNDSSVQRFLSSPVQQFNDSTFFYSTHLRVRAFTQSPVLIFRIIENVPEAGIEPAQPLPAEGF
jgi:hypothetical protein